MKTEMNICVQPNDINTNGHLWDCFGRVYVEVAANLIIKMSKGFGYWKWFTLDELYHSADNIGCADWSREISILLSDGYLMAQLQDNPNSVIEYHITPKFITAIKTYIKPEIIVKKDEPMEIKQGMLVKAHDISYSVGVDKDGKLFSYYEKHNTGGRDTPFNLATLYKVVAKGIEKLSSCLVFDSLQWSNDNDTIVQDVKTKEIVFMREEFLYPVEVCSVCGHTKEIE